MIQKINHHKRSEQDDILCSPLFIMHAEIMLPRVTTCLEKDVTIEEELKFLAHTASFTAVYCGLKN